MDKGKRSWRKIIDVVLSDAFAVYNSTISPCIGIFLTALSAGMGIVAAVKFAVWVGAIKSIAIPVYVFPLLKK